MARRATKFRQKGVDMTTHTRMYRKGQSRDSVWNSELGKGANSGQINS